MSSKTAKAIGNKKLVRKPYGDSSIQHKIAKAESKKLVKIDKLNKLNDELDNLSELPPDKQLILPCCGKVKNS